MSGVKMINTDMEFNTGIIIQARVSSTRLPKKIIIELDDGNTFLDILIERLKILKEKFPIVIAISDNKNDGVLVDFAKKHDILLYRGSEHNVLERFIKASEYYKFNTIIRICSDNPFIDIDSIIELNENYNKEDYLSFSINNVPSILTHYGFFSEIVSLESLKEIQSSGKNGCREHVTNCIYSNEKKFNVRFIEKKIHCKNIRCTLDTLEDFNNLKYIYFNWFKKKGQNNFNYFELIDYIKSNFELMDKMKLEIKKHEK